jgi:hypothetical protein
MVQRFIFTVATGRCGQASLSELINRHVKDAYAAFEEPQVRPVLPGGLGDVERRFRRRFVETDELLGRGRVLRAHTNGDTAYIDRVVAKRLLQIKREMASKEKSVYVDVSKYFARGLHLGYARAIRSFGLVLLVRDPVKNMRSFLNRDKNFFKDNPPTNVPGNLLRLDSASLSRGELYLWAWCEIYLRYLALRDAGHGAPAIEIRTDDLVNNDRMTEHFRSLDLAFEPLTPVPALNTNVGSGREPTIVSQEDVRTFERFLEKLPVAVIERIDYLRSYKPRAAA